MDLAHALKVALETGKVQLGRPGSPRRGRGEEGQAPHRRRARAPTTKLRSDRTLGKVPIYHYDGTAVELGQACGCPFPDERDGDPRSGLERDPLPRDLSRSPKRNLFDR